MGQVDIRKLARRDGLSEWIVCMVNVVRKEAGMQGEW